MGILLAAARIGLPQFMRRRELANLLKVTAGAFNADAPSTRAEGSQDYLKLFARFTREQAERSLAQGRGLDDGERLFRQANLLGSDLKKRFRISGAREVMEMGKIVYKVLGIEFEGDLRGQIVIKRCFFSSYYSGRVCRLVSNLDQGLLAGLSGGARLTFSRRITEGDSCCQAYLALSEARQ